MSEIIRVSRIEKPTAIQLTKTNAKAFADFIKTADNVDISSVRAGGGWVKANFGFGLFTFRAGHWAVLEFGEVAFYTEEQFKAEFRKLK